MEINDNVRPPNRRKDTIDGCIIRQGDCSRGGECATVSPQHRVEQPHKSRKHTLETPEKLFSLKPCEQACVNYEAVGFRESGYPNSLIQHNARRGTALHLHRWYLAGKRGGAFPYRSSIIPRYFFCFSDRGFALPGPHLGSLHQAGF